MRSRIFLMFGFVLGLVLVVMFGSFILTSEYQYKGSRINPASPAVDFHLIDQDGNVFQLSQQRGKVVVIFFGYTHCQDVCPMTLAQFKQLRLKLSEYSQVRFVFITVDPERDTSQVLKEYLSAFDPNLTGLNGSRIDLEKVWQEYGVTVTKTEGSSEENYGVEHSARIYVIDRKGNLQLTYPIGFETSGILDDLNHLPRSVR